jgi:hypothetical protein
MYHGCTSRVRAATRPALRSALAGAGERFPSGRRRPLRMRQVRGKAAVFTDSGQLDGPGRKQRAGQPLFLGQSQVGELPLHVEADPESAPTAAAEPGTRVAFAFETSVQVSSISAAVPADRPRAMERRIRVRPHRPGGPLHHLGEVMLDDLRAGLPTDVLLLQRLSTVRRATFVPLWLARRGAEWCRTVRRR